MTTNPRIEKTSFLINWLERPYTLNNNPYYKLLICLSMGLLTYLFLQLYQPHDALLNQERHHYHTHIPSVLIAVVSLFHNFIVTLLFPSYFNPNKWNIGKHLFNALYCMFLTSVVYWFFLNYFERTIETKNVEFKYVLYLFFTIGLFPLSIYLFIDERYGNYSNKKEQKKSILNEKDNIISNIITIYSYNEKNKIVIDINKLVYITSEVNYASFFVLKQNKLKEIVLRKPLVKIEDDFRQFENIIRIHKSYFINSNYVINIKGNARAFYLSLDFTDIEIPVSRQFSRRELEKILL